MSEGTSVRGKREEEEQEEEEAEEEMLLLLKALYRMLEQVCDRPRLRRRSQQ